MKLLLVIVAFIAVFLSKLNCQVDTSLRVITTFSGREYIGKIMSDDGRELQIETSSIGKLFLPKSEVKNITQLKSSKQIIFNEYSGEGPFTTRYIFTNNAHPIRRGENYYMINLFGPEFHFAVSNRMNIGIMTTWIGSPFVLAMKYTFKKEESKLNFSSGTLLGSSGYIDNFKTFGGLHWLSCTVGDRANNLTFSAGYGYFQINRSLPVIDENLTNTINYQNVNFLINGPLASFSSIFKVSARSSFVLDNMLFIYRSEDRIINQEMIKAEGIDPITNTWTPAEYKFRITKVEGINAAALIMPGFRFQKSDLLATQFSIAMFLLLSEKTEPISFPIPMVSWFRKF